MGFIPMISATQSNHPLSIVSKLTPEIPLIEEARNRIRNARMRVTKPRVAIIESLLAYKGPVSIERIHQDAGHDVCDLVTVYRCLSAFEEIDMVRRTYLHNGTCLYELTLGSPRRYHIVCKSCGSTERVDFFSVNGVEELLRERGYGKISHVVEFFGVCPACQQAAPRRAVAPAISHADL
jgi:Fur family ferric uptake transcriptional regulator